MINDEDIDKLLNDDVINEIKDKTNCPTCKTNDFLIEDFVQGTIVCSNCGLVITNLISENIETKLYEDKDGTYKSMPVSAIFPQSSLGTSIRGNYKNKLKMIHNWNAMPYKERSLNNVFKEIQSKCEKGGILKCIEQDAKIMYKMLSECKYASGKNKGKFIITRGINRTSLIAACVFIACRKKEMTRSLSEISELFGIRYTEITKGCKTFLRLMDLRGLEMDLGTSLPEHFIDRYCKHLNLPRFIIEHAIKISRNITKFNIASSHTPISIAVVCILIVSEINNIEFINKKMLSKVFMISEVTITKAYNKIKQFSRVILDDTIFKMSVDEQEKEDVEVPEFVKRKLSKIQPINPMEKLNKILSCPELDMEEGYNAILEIYEEDMKHQ